VGGFVPDRRELEAVFRAGRAKGLGSKRRLVTVTLSLDPGQIEQAMWFSGARTITELVTFALTRLARTTDRPRPVVARLAARKRRRKGATSRGEA
jgi:hypothetical protein